MPAHLLSDKTSGSEFYSIRGGEAPWGDYGDMLIHGMSSHLGRQGGLLRLERTGPFIPPITFPGIQAMVVTTATRDAMTRAGFQGINFQPVIKARIVKVDWHTWDLTAEEPKYYPEEGEPEEYILSKEHSEEMSRKLGELWEVVISHGVVMNRLPKKEEDLYSKFCYQAGSRNDADLFSCTENGHIYCSARAKVWFDDYFSRWTSFEPWDA